MSIIGQQKEGINFLPFEWKIKVWWRRYRYYAYLLGALWAILLLGLGTAACISYTEYAHIVDKYEQIIKEAQSEAKQMDLYEKGLKKLRPKKEVPPIEGNVALLIKLFDYANRSAITFSEIHIDHDKIILKGEGTTNLRVQTFGDLLHQIHKNIVFQGQQNHGEQHKGISFVFTGTTRTTKANEEVREHN